MGYYDIRELIIQTLTNRPHGTEIQPEDHQAFALALNDYIRSVELVAGNGVPIGFAESDTSPVQPNNGYAVYLSTVGSGETVLFSNFINENGKPISISSDAGEVSLVILLWNGVYWSSQITKVRATIEIFNEFLFKRVLTSTDDTPDAIINPSFYIADKPGTYVNFSNLVVEDEVCIFKSVDGTNWIKEPCNFLIREIFDALKRVYSFSNSIFTTASIKADKIELGNEATANAKGACSSGKSTASGLYSHAEGKNTVASGLYSHAEGKNTVASGQDSHAEGYLSQATGDYGSHAEGQETVAEGIFSHAEGYLSQATKDGAHAEGENTVASGDISHAEGDNSKASGSISHAEGENTVASGDISHAEGDNTVASGSSSHAEGENTVASGDFSHAEGQETVAEGNFSHAEGYLSQATKDGAHAEGDNTVASGSISHAEGQETVAEGNFSHAEGQGTIAKSDSQHVSGKYNVEDTNGDYALIVGNGTDSSNRSNAFAIDWNGNLVLFDNGTPVVLTPDKLAQLIS